MNLAKLQQVEEHDDDQEAASDHEYVPMSSPQPEQSHTPSPADDRALSPDDGAELAEEDEQDEQVIKY